MLCTEWASHVNVISDRKRFMQTSLFIQTHSVSGNTRNMVRAIFGCGLELQIQFSLKLSCLSSFYPNKDKTNLFRPSPSLSWIVSHTWPQSFINSCNLHPFTCPSLTLPPVPLWNYASVKPNLCLALSTAPP